MKVNKILYSILFACGFIAISSTSFTVAARNLFEILNKTNNPIWVSVFSPDQEAPSASIRRVFRQSSGSAVEIDGSKDVNLLIWTNDPGEKVNLSEAKSDYVYQFTSRKKDILVTFNPGDKRGDLYPQTGTYGGWSGKTESGFPLGDNIKEKNIILFSKDQQIKK